MEEYSRYSSSWMWNLHQREEDYPYGGAAGNDGGSAPRNAGGGCEDFGNSLDQLNKIVERIAPDGRSSIPKKEMHPRKMLFHESHFGDGGYEPFLGCSGNDGMSEMMDEYPSHMTGYDGSGWSHSSCEPYRGNAYQGMTDGRMVKVETVAESRNFKSKREAVTSKKESLSKKESALSKLIEDRCGRNFERRRSNKNVEEFEGDESHQKTTKRIAIESQESPNIREYVEGCAAEELDGKQRTQSSGWSGSKQLLEIGKYTEAGGKNITDTTSPHDSIGHLTNYGESSVNYDSMSSHSMGGNVAYVSPAEQTMSDCADTKTDDDAKLYTCSQCSYHAVKKGQLRKHMSVHGVFLCAHCEFLSEHGDSLEAHRRAHHPGLCGRKLCKKCRVLYQGDELKEHERQCSGEKQRWPCPTCNKEFKFVSVMKAHLRKWHPSAAASLIGDHGLADCFPPMADSTTEEAAAGSDLDSEQGALAKSARKPEPEHSFQCEDCDKAFKTKWMLSNHLVLHCTDAPFFCDTNGCSTTFRSDKELNVHRMKVHELGPKKYPCCHPDCSMQFAKYGHYKRHKLTHIVGERKFKCDWPNCGKAFSHTDNLKVHYRRHTDEKPYKCQLCESSYRQKSGLKYHLEKVHDEKSTGRPGRKRKNLRLVEEEPKRPDIAKTGKVVATDCDGCLCEPHDDCSLSSILNGSERGLKKKMARNSMAVELLVKKPRLAMKEEANEVGHAHASLKQEAASDLKVEDDREDLAIPGTISSASSGKPNASGNSSAQLGEISLNDEWVIDESYNDVDVKREYEEEGKRSRAVESSSSFHCASPKMEPLDVDLGEELLRLSDVINSEIHLNRGVENEAPPAADATTRMGEFKAGERAGIARDDSGAYLQRYAVPFPLHGSYKTHPDLFREVPSQVDLHDPFPARKYRPYGQFCCNSMSEDRTASSEMGSYSAGGFANRLRPASSDPRIAVSNNPPSAMGHPIPFDESGTRAWLPSDAGALDDASPVSGRSTRSELSAANSGDVADHYREAQTALLPTCSPIIQHQASADDELTGNGAYVERPASRTRQLAPSWSQGFEEEEDDHEEEEEEEEDDDDGDEENDAGGEERWTDRRENWYETSYSDHPVSSMGNSGGDVPFSQASGTLQSTPDAMCMPTYSANQSPIVWSAGKDSELAFGSRMQGGVAAGYGVGGPSGWNMDDGMASNFRTGSFAAGNNSYKRTSAYGLQGVGLRDEAYDANSREPAYYSASHHRPAQMYRYYGPGDGYPQHQYGQVNAAPYDPLTPGHPWNTLPPEERGFLTMPANMRGPLPSPDYPLPSMMYPQMPPYF